MTARPREALVILSVIVAPCVAGALDVTGKWRFDTTPPLIVQVTQAGSALSFTIGPFAFSGSLSAAGSFTNYSVSASSPVRATMDGRIMPSAALLDGRVVVAPFMPGDLPAVGGVVARRCTCDDGNVAGGDGCDATCQIEPCWACTGDPSVCSPLPDGSACEDGRVCTTGETCSAGICGGGAPVSPCVDMTGRWNRHGDAPALGVTYDSATDVTQFGSDVILAGYVGTIDPATGAFDLRAPNLNLFCSAFDPLVGSVAASGVTYSAAGSLDRPREIAPDQCDSFPLTETATRCGSGTIDLVEECDDGNQIDGDGCSAGCVVEPCWTCAGEPSTCVTRPRSPCKASTAPELSTVRIKNGADDTKDTFVWMWTKGEATALAELGSPPSGDSYALCIYGEASPTPTLLFRAAIPGGGTCGGAPCWKPKGRRGFRYEHDGATPEGVRIAHVESGDAGKARIVVEGNGAHLSDRSVGLPTIPVSTPLRVQLQGANGLCAETHHDAGSVLTNDPVKGRFRARGVP